MELKIAIFLFKKLRIPNFVMRWSVRTYFSREDIYIQHTCIRGRFDKKMKSHYIFLNDFWFSLIILNIAFCNVNCNVKVYSIFWDVALLRTATMSRAVEILLVIFNSNIFWYFFVFTFFRFKKLPELHISLIFTTLF